MEASELDVLGPVDYLVVEFPADKAPAAERRDPRFARDRGPSSTQSRPTRSRSAQRS
jgi:hypothetical protein